MNITELNEQSSARLNKGLSTGKIPTLLNQFDTEDSNRKIDIDSLQKKYKDFLRILNATSLSAIPVNNRIRASKLLKSLNTFIEEMEIRNNTIKKTITKLTTDAEENIRLQDLAAMVKYVGEHVHEVSPKKPKLLATPKVSKKKSFISKLFNI